LADTRNIAVPKDAETPGEKGLLYCIAFNILVFEKRDDGLSHCHTLCRLLIHGGSPIIYSYNPP
jgi:hypothetical protein